MARHGCYKKENHKKVEKNKKYYDYDFVRNAMRLTHQDPVFVIQKLTDYLLEYPKDYATYLSLANVFISIGSLAKAQKLIDTVEPLVFSDASYAINNPKGFKEFKKILTITKLKIAFYSYDFKKALDMIEKNEDIIAQSDIESIGALKLYCRVRLGISNIENEKIDSYKRKQISEYSEERFLEHIKKHVDGFEGEEISESRFYKTFDIEKVLNEAKKYIPNQIARHRGFIEDNYYFKYDNCGHYNNINRNFFKMTAYSGTDNFITMCPARCESGVHYIDLNYLNKEDETFKTKKLSRIDKFNQKYKNVL